jgi:hypothetical protein
MRKVRVGRMDREERYPGSRHIVGKNFSVQANLNAQRQSLARDGTSV